MAIPKTKTYDHLGGQVNVETDSGSVKDPESGIPVKQDIDELKGKSKTQGEDVEALKEQMKNKAEQSDLNDLGLEISKLERVVGVERFGSNNISKGGKRYIVIPFTAKYGDVICVDIKSNALYTDGVAAGNLVFNDAGKPVVGNILSGVVNEFSVTEDVSSIILYFTGTWMKQDTPVEINVSVVIKDNLLKAVEGVKKDVADNKEQIVDCKNDIKNLGLEVDGKLNDLYDINRVEYSCQTESGAIVTNGAAGTIVNVNDRLSGAVYRCAVIECRKGDKFIVVGTGGNSPRLWCFVDEEYKILGDEYRAKNDASSATGVTIYAPKDGYLIANTISANPNLVVKLFKMFPAEDINKTINDANEYTNSVDIRTRTVEDLTLLKVKNSVIKTDVGIGNIVDVSKTSSPNTSVIFESCKKGEKFYVYGIGGQSSRLWCFTDKDLKVKDVSIANANAANGVLIESSCDGYIIVNSQNESTYNLRLVRYCNDTIEAIIKKALDAKDKEDQNETVFEYNYKAYGVHIVNYKFESGDYIISYADDELDKKITISYVYDDGSTSIIFDDVPQNELSFFKVIENDVAGIQVYYTSTHVGGRAKLTIKRLSKEKAIPFDKQMNGISHQFGFGINGKYEVPTLDRLENKTDWLGYFYGLFDSLVEMYPNYISKVDCDTDSGIQRPSYMDGCPIYMYKFIPSRTPKTSTGSSYDTYRNLMKVMIVGGTHPEYVSIYDLYHTMRIICEEWQTDENISSLRWDAEYYVIPCEGSWGVQHGSRNNYNDVDLNRNCPTLDWKHINYGGASAASEYETKILVHYFEQIKPNVFIDHHNTNAGDGKNLVYITSRYTLGVDIGAAHITCMTARWKKRFADTFPNDDIIYGFSQKTIEHGTRVGYACENGALGFTYESNHAIMYRGGVLYDTAQEIMSSRVVTIATDGFLNFLLRALKTYSDRAM